MIIDNNDNANKNFMVYEVRYTPAVLGSSSYYNPSLNPYYILKYTQIYFQITAQYIVQVFLHTTHRHIQDVTVPKDTCSMLYNL
jgi:hypothetical protein